MKNENWTFQLFQALSCEFDQIYIAKILNIFLNQYVFFPIGNKSNLGWRCKKNSPGHRCEGQLHIESRLGRGLHEGHVVLPPQTLPILPLHLPLAAAAVGLVACGLKRKVDSIRSS